MNHTLSVIVRLAVLKHIIYAKITIFDKFAILQVQNIWKTENFFIICLRHIHNLVLVSMKILVEKNECSLIIKVNFVNNFD